jgi:small subunit ribosomal protein S5
MSYTQNDNRRGSQGGRQPREPKEFDEKVIQVNRVSKKTKGGNQMGFSVLMVIGDKKGKVGVGLGKAKDVLSAIQKGVKKAKRRLFQVPVQGTTIPFAINIKLGAAHIMLKPAPAGSGIIAGGAIRAVVDAAGIRDISSKIKGTSNQASNVYATIDALKQLRAIVDRKGIKLKSVFEAEKEEKERLREQAAKEQAARAQAKKELEAKKPVVKPAEKPVEKPEEKKVTKKIAKVETEAKPGEKTVKAETTAKPIEKVAEKPVEKKA